jgi:hypothetical protein
LTEANAWCFEKQIAKINADVAGQGKTEHIIYGFKTGKAAQIFQDRFGGEWFNRREWEALQLADYMFADAKSVRPSRAHCHAAGSLARPGRPDQTQPKTFRLSMPASPPGRFRVRVVANPPRETL